MAFPLRSLSWALVTIVSTAALLYSILRPGTAGPILGVVMFALYVGLMCEVILDLTMRTDLRLRQRAAWLALCILVVPLVPIMAGVYFLLGRRRTALAFGGPPQDEPDPSPGRVPHRPHSVRANVVRALRLRMSR